MKIQSRRLVILLLGLFSCKNNIKSIDDHVPNAVFLLLEQAKDTQKSLDERLRIAIRADSIAMKESDRKKHLDCSELIASIYLQQNEMDSALYRFTQSLTIANELVDQESIPINLSGIGSVYSAKNILNIFC